MAYRPWSSLINDRLWGLDGGRVGMELNSWKAGTAFVAPPSYLHSRACCVWPHTRPMTWPERQTTVAISPDSKNPFQPSPYLDGDGRYFRQADRPVQLVHASR
ncbi:hypothetical protein B0T17DRAFT_654847 [Bombardia bombarda]|uniref:Uncharacterized protein n=1 Tax=Bombardia bombarda TaxID=252184 RepID=A0AA39X0I4_9PEZI|nr:hypothetical protein B0T17DRAFT_654847 [Bombardia bombarda]